MEFLLALSYLERPGYIASTAMAQLDHYSVLRVFESIETVQDVLRTQQAHSSLHSVGSANSVWAKFLQRDFDVFAEVGLPPSQDS